MSYQYPGQPQGGPPPYGAPPSNYGPPPNIPPNQIPFPPNQAPPQNFVPPPAHQAGQPQFAPPPQAVGPPPPQQQQPPIRQFPLAFSIYRKPFSGTYYLGEHQENPIYSITHHSGLTSNPDLIVHRTPDSHSPALATANSSGHFSMNSDIEIPGAPVGTIKLQHGSGWGDGTFSFDLPVGQGVERFEWRHSKGKEVKQTQKHAHEGWKLVRLARQGSTSDGKEVVAVWAENERSLSKEGSFQFLGSGATGELGSLWEVVAVVSYLRVGQKTEKAASSAGAGGGGGGGG